MIVINRKAIEEFKSKHADARKPLDTWLAVVTHAKWATPSDIREVFRSADFLSGNRVVFNIKGNNCRLLVLVVFFEGTVRVLRVGTHSEYSTWKLE